MKNEQPTNQESKMHKIFSTIKEKLTEESNKETSESTIEEDDFSPHITAVKNKIKKLFIKSSTKTTRNTDDSEEQPQQDEELNIDLGEIKIFLAKHATLFFLILIVALQFMPNEGWLPWGGLWMRLQTQDLHILDDFAQNSVYNFYRNQISNAIIQQYPTLPEENKNKLIDEQLNKVLKENAQQVDEQIAQTAEYLKDQERYEENGIKYTMMPDIDPYFYLRFARNYLDHGNIGDEIKNGEWRDTKAIAPQGMNASAYRELHPYVLAYLHKIAKIFNPQIPLMQSAAYSPIIFVTFAVIFAFLFARKITNNIGGIFSATMIAVSSAAVARTQWGHADTDAYNLFFPMLISWLFVESAEARETKKRYLLILLNAFIIGVYSYTWMGWWYVFDFMLAAIGIKVVYTLIFNRAKLKDAVLMLMSYFIGTAIFSIIIRGGIFRFLMNILGPLQFTIMKNAANTDLWPNVYTTVAELNPTSISGAINSAGGDFFLVIAIIGLILLMIKKEIPRRNRILYTAFLTFWMIATIYATTKGVRFSILITPAIATLFGVSAGLFKEKISELNKNHWNIKQPIVTIIVISLFALIIIQSGQVKDSYAQSKNDLPILNKAWWTALTAIKNNSTKDAIINSWWDFGHHFKYVADRAVTFDGAHQTSPMAHWIGKVLATDDEEEAIALLRMMDCGSRLGFDAIDKQRDKDTIRAVKILNNVIKIKKKEDAKKYLEKEGLKNTEEILNYTHCNPPEDYFITSEDMVGKAGVWSHFGMWNFERAYVWMKLRNRTKDDAVQDMINKFNYTQNQAEQTYFDAMSLKNEGEANTWISGWAGYLSGFDGCNQDNQTITCGNGAIINKTNMDTFIRTDGRLARPKYLSYIDEKTLKFTTKEFNDSQVNLAVILVPSGNMYRSVIASAEHAKSIFTRLFYMDGHGLKYFKKFNEQNQLIGGGKIIVWKIDWNGNEQNILETFKSRTQPSTLRTIKDETK